MELESVQYSTVSTKGLAVIPKAVREHLGLRQGDRVAFVVTEEGVWLQPAISGDPLEAGLGLLAPARIDVLAEKRAELEAEEAKAAPPRPRRSTRVAEAPSPYRPRRRR